MLVRPIWFSLAIGDFKRHSETDSFPNKTPAGVASRRAHRMSRGSALGDRQHVALDRAAKELAWTANFVLGVADHLIELCNPAHCARQCEDAGEHVDRNADGTLHDAGVKVNVGVELARDKILVFERNFFQCHCQLEQWIIFEAEYTQD